MGLICETHFLKSPSSELDHELLGAEVLNVLDPHVLVALVRPGCHALLSKICYS